jgi:hypothetical protein
MSDKWTILAVIIGVLALVPLFTGGWALSFATRESLRRNTTRGFFVSVGAKLRGELWGVLATLPLIIVCYIFVCLIVSVRLLLGAEPGVTLRHLRGLLIGAVLAAAFVGCASAFLIVPLMDMAWGSGTLAPGVLGGIYGLLSIWWLPSVLSVPLGAIIGLSRTDARRSDAIDPPELTGRRQRVVPADETSRPPEKAKKRARKLAGYMAIGFGVLATFLWTAYATLDSTGKPGAGVNLDFAVLVGLVGSAIGGCVGWLIDDLRG